MTARAWKGILMGVVLAACIAAVAWTSIKPRVDRSWIPEQSRLAAATVTGDTVRIRDMRDFTYRARQDFTPQYVDKTYDLNKLQSVWFVLTPFGKEFRGMAHSFVSFGFSDSQFVAISVEARREVGETYNGLTGIFKRFELMYVIGEERDLIGQRAVFSEHNVYLYPIRTTPQKKREMFLSMLARANQLREQPEFYNTLTNNCTSNVVEHVNAITPGKVPRAINTIVPGYTDEAAMELGMIDTDLDLERARERYMINARAKRYFTDPAFSFRIREPDAPASQAGTTQPTTRK